MTILYISDQGAYLRKQGQRLIIEKAGQKIQQIHAFKVEQIVLMGNVAITPGAVAFLLQQGIDTVFMSIYGKYRGRLLSEFGKNIDLRCIQFRKMEDQNIKLELARAYIMGKLSNCRILMRQHNRSLHNQYITEALHQIRMLSRKLAAAGDIPELMGLEGRSAAVYFKGFGQMIKSDQFSFTHRNRRPPKDPVNVLLSLGYTLLGNAIQTQINVAGLDPFLGCLHGAAYGRPSLVLDLIEEFRPVIVDSLVLSVINKKIIKVTDFYRPEEKEPAAFAFAEEEQAAQERPIIFIHSGMKKFIAQFENRLNQKVFYLPTSQRLSYREIFLEQVRLLVRHLKEEDVYNAFQMR